MSNNEQVLEKTPNYDICKVLMDYEDSVKSATFDELWIETCRLSNEDRIPERESRILDVIEQSEDAYLAHLYNSMKVCKRWFKGCEAELNQLYEKKKKEMKTNREASMNF